MPTINQTGNAFNTRVKEVTDRLGLGIVVGLAIMCAICSLAQIFCCIKYKDEEQEGWYAIDWDKFNKDQARLKKLNADSSINEDEDEKEDEADIAHVAPPNVNPFADALQRQGEKTMFFSDSPVTARAAGELNKGWYQAHPQIREMETGPRAAHIHDYDLDGDYPTGIDGDYPTGLDEDGNYPTGADGEIETGMDSPSAIEYDADGHQITGGPRRFTLDGDETRPYSPTLDGMPATGRGQRSPTADGVAATGASASMVQRRSDGGLNHTPYGDSFDAMPAPDGQFTGMYDANTLEDNESTGLTPRPYDPSYPPQTMSPSNYLPKGSLRQTRGEPSMVHMNSRPKRHVEFQRPREESAPRVKRRFAPAQPTNTFVADSNQSLPDFDPPAFDEPQSQSVLDVDGQLERMYSPSNETPRARTLHVSDSGPLNGFVSESYGGQRFYTEQSLTAVTAVDESESALDLDVDDMTEEQKEQAYRELRSHSSSKGFLRNQFRDPNRSDVPKRRPVRPERVMSLEKDKRAPAHVSTPTGGWRTDSANSIATATEEVDFDDLGLPEDSMTASESANFTPASISANYTPASANYTASESANYTPDLLHVEPSPQTPQDTRFRVDSNVSLTAEEDDNESPYSVYQRRFLDRTESNI